MSDIWALDGKSWAIGMMMGRRFKYKANGNTLTVWSEEKGAYPVYVTTNRGIFIEAINEAGEVVSGGGDGGWCYIPIGEKPVTLRYKALPKPELSKAQLDKARKVVTRYLVSGMPNLPDTLPATIKWLNGKLAKIPVASRAKARCRFDTTTGYGETYPNLEITYDESETDNEVIARLQVETERARIIEEKERAALRNLQSKYAE